MELQLVVIPVGSSYEDRGMRNDQHDTVAALLKIPICPLDIGASQPDDYAITTAAQPAAGSGIEMMQVTPTVMLERCHGNSVWHLVGPSRYE